MKDICLCYVNKDGDFEIYDYYCPHTFEETGQVAWVSYFGVLTWEFLTEIRRKHEGAFVCTEAHALKLMDAQTEKDYKVGVVQEISKESWEYSLEVLPPGDFSSDGFRLDELITWYKQSQLFYHFLSYKGGYYKMVWHKPDWRSILREKVDRGDFIPLAQ